MPKSINNVLPGRSSGAGFERFLGALSPESEAAGERYLELCFKLRKFFAWKCCRESDLDELVDETIDRVVKKFRDGEVVDNVNAYAGGVARNVWHEYVRRRTEVPLGDDDLPNVTTPEDSEDEARYRCLDECLAKLPPDDRELILGYYDVEEMEKNKDHRKKLGELFRKSSGALKVHATRLRDKLRRCLALCLSGGEM